MINPTDRVPQYPGRVRLTPVPGQANTYDLERADQPTQPGTPLNRTTLQLLQADIRSYPAGEDLAAGDVVDVVDGVAKKVYRSDNIQPSTFFSSGGRSPGTVCVVNEKVVVLYTYTNNYYKYAQVGELSGSTIMFNDNRASLDVNGSQSDTKSIHMHDNIVVFALGFGGNGIRLVAAEVTSTNTVSFIMNTSQTVNMNGLSIGLIKLSESSFLLIGGGGGAMPLEAMICTINSNNTFSFGTKYSMSAPTAAYLAATYVRKQSDGRIKVCVCFDGTSGDYNKKVCAAILWVNTNNTCSWSGTTVLSTASAYSGTINCCSNGDRAYVGFVDNSNTNQKTFRVLELDLSGSNIVLVNDTDTGVIPLDASNLEFVISNGTPVLITKEGNACVAYLYDVNSKAFIGPTTLIEAGIKCSYIIASTVTEDNKIIFICNISGGEGKGTAFVATVMEKSIAGAFYDASAQAITLKSCKKGAPSDLLFEGGITDVSWAKAGTTIKSNGVTGYSPLDGWLFASPFWANKEYASVCLGSYIGTGTYGGGATVKKLIFNFAPKMVVVNRRGDSRQWGILLKPSKVGMQMDSSVTSTIVFGSVNNVTWGADFVSWGNGGSSTQAANELNVIYDYIAFG